METELTEEKEMKESFDEVLDFGEESGLADLKLTVEGRTIPVIKGLLCMASPKLCSILESTTELDLPEKKYDDVVEFLKCIYPNKLKTITDENVYKVLPLASEYQVEKLKRRSEKVLLAKMKQHFMKNALELYRHIKLAELYGMEELKQACIYAASDLKLPDLKGARSVHSISLENDLMIKELAIEKHELDKADDLQLDVLSQKPPAQQSSSQTTNNPNRYFHDFLWGRMSYPANPSEALRSARLWKRYFPSSDKTDVLRKLKEMQVKNCKEFETEFKLLPEEIKQAIL